MSLILHCTRRVGKGRFDFPHREKIIYDFEENLDDIVAKQSQI
jgi:hypothetical protein